MSGNASVLILARETRDGQQLKTTLEQFGLFRTTLHAKDLGEAEKFLREEPADLVLVILEGLEKELLPFLESKRASLAWHAIPTLIVGEPEKTGIAPTDLIRHDFDLLYPPVDRLELIARLHLQLKIRAMQKSLSRNQLALTRSAGTDPLTLLQDRRTLLNQAESEISRSRSRQQACSLVLLDLDRFRQFNHEQGYPRGNRLLHEVGRTLRRELRDYDYAARVENDTFALLLPDTPLDGAWRVAERLREALAEYTPSFVGKMRKLTLCQGIATSYGRESDSAASLMNQAEAALGQAMTHGTDWITSDGG